MTYFTKSRFKLALECPTKLYYSSNDYSNQKVDDPFLEALAEGGYQVGELAKYLFCDNPIADDITIETLNYQDSAALTAVKRSKPLPIVVAEAAFQYSHFFVRTDIITEDENVINLYEVKAKSWDEDTEFLKTIAKGPDKGIQKLDRGWSPYLHDVAFQKYVLSKANPSKRIKAHLILADKTKNTSIEGLNQLFRIEKNGDRKKIIVQQGITRKDLGDIPLRIINVDQECEWIYSNPVDIDLEGVWGFEKLIHFLAEKHINNEIIWTSNLNRKCKDCEFINPDYPEGLRSGFHECWIKVAGLSESDLREDSILELWGGGSGSVSHVNNAIDANIYLLKHAEEALYAPKKREIPTGRTMDATSRRTIQIQKSRAADFEPHIDVEGLQDVFENLTAPYHFIDFETTMVAIPFHKNRKPYEAVAFQYSYHLIDEKGNISHKSQYLSFDRGVFPNYEFLRNLRNDLSGKPGTIFRYHNHENTYLNHIYKQLMLENVKTVQDREELMNFIREISHPTGDTPDKWESINDMQDLYKLVLSHFYSLHAKGSNSIKDILPATIRSSDYLRSKYGQPIYGTAKMPSLNFKIPHAWIVQEKDFNPYNTLPTLFNDVDRIDFELSDNNLMELKDGGSAMMAYAYLQFTNLPDEQREIYRNGLLRYCELDTLAMAMIWDYWGNAIGRW